MINIHDLLQERELVKMSEVEIARITGGASEQFGRDSGEQFGRDSAPFQVLPKESAMMSEEQVKYLITRILRS